VVNGAGAPEQDARVSPSRLLIVAAVLGALWWLPAPGPVGPRGVHLFALFVATIVGLVVRPLPMSGVVFLSVAVAGVTQTLTIGEALSGYGDPTVWLVMVAFLFSRAFRKTGLGRRIACAFIRAFGARTLGLGYALSLSDLALAPAIPSGTARCAGVLYPVVREVASTLESEPGPTADRAGRFLVLNSFQAHAITQAMFLTSMAANPLIVKIAKEVSGADVSWGRWALAALVPGVLSLTVMTFVVYRLSRPSVTRTPGAAAWARKELSALGPLKREERLLLGTFVLTVALWITGRWTGIDATTAALCGVVLNVLFGVLKWSDVLEERSAWDAFIWLGGLVSLCGMLGKLGLTSWFATQVSSFVTGWAWLPALGVLALVYFYSHYAFASATAHIAAMLPPFLTVALTVGAPPMLAVLVLAFMSSLCCGLTHYGGGPAPVYFGAGYVTLREWWRVGFVVSVVNIAVWLGVGTFYWRVLGLL
jgi:DASS family divalent anion:Na+ symporter